MLCTLLEIFVCSPANENVFSDYLRLQKLSLTCKVLFNCFSLGTLHNNNTMTGKNTKCEAQQNYFFQHFKSTSTIIVNIWYQENGNQLWLKLNFSTIYFTSVVPANDLTVQQ